jgi:hypothetical protein
MKVSSGISSGTLPRVQHAYDAFSRAARHPLDFPHALSAVAAVLLEDTRARCAEPPRKRHAKFGRAAIAVRVAAPAKMLCAIKHLLDAHLEDDVRMGADPRPARGDVAQQRIEGGTRLALMNGIHPHQHAVGSQKLRAHCIGKFLVVNDRLRIDAERAQLLEDAVEAIAPRRGSLPRFAIAAPQDSDFVGFRRFIPSTHSRPRSEKGAALGRMSDGVSASIPHS